MTCVKRSSTLGASALAVATSALLALPATAGSTSSTVAASTVTGTAPTTTAPPTTTGTTPTPAPPVTAPASRTIVAGVAIAGVPVGGLTGDQALTKLRGVFTASIVVNVDGKQTFTYTVDRWGQKALVKAAVRTAVAARKAKAIPVAVTFSGSSVLKEVATISSSATVETREPTWAFGGGEGRVVPGRDGLIVPTSALKRAIVQAIRIPLHRVRPIAIGRKHSRAASPGTIGPAIVIRRAANALTLWTVTKKGKPVARKVFGVATGQSSYPTPSGLFHIYSKQRNPWWYPPKGSPWVTDPTPVPPGPGNPLGTRWMEFAPAVGIHGTPDAASIGYSASHGCVRMHIPDAEWLFDHVSIGTPVRVY